MNRRSLMLLLLVTCLTWQLPTFAKNQNGRIGLGVKADGDGPFWNPVIRSLTVVPVPPGLPASQAGILVGDEITEIDGKTVAGAIGSELGALMEKAPGETLNLKLVRKDGGHISVSLIAVADD
jgi:C-terminal processing protease CtpA/Prc